jgi:hypothetical protein
VATYYVDPAGDDSNPGTELLPWETVDKAATTAVAGDTVIYENGTYDLGIGQQSPDWNTGTAVGGYITHQARNKHLAIWQQTSYGPGYAIEMVDLEYIKLIGISIQQAVITNINRLVHIETCGYMEFTQVELTNFAAYGLFLLSDSTDACHHVTVDDCDIHPEDAASVNPGKDGIIMWGPKCSDIEIKNSRIYHTQHNGIGSQSAQPATCDYHIHDNYIYAIDSHGVSISSAVVIIEDNLIEGAGTWPLDDNDSNGVRLHTNVNATVRFNQIYGCSGRALWVSVTSGNVDFHHNTCYGNNYKVGLDDQGDIQFRADGATGGSFAVTFQNNIIHHVTDGRKCLVIETSVPAGNITLDYNLWYDPTDYDYMRRGGTVYGSIADYLAVYEDHSLEGNPAFVDAPSDDFELTAGSPAIDAGTDLGYPYRGTNPDMGALEYEEGVIVYVTVVTVVVVVI